MARASSSRWRSLGSVGLWSLVSGTASSLGAVRAGPGCTRVRETTARLSPTHPVVSVRAPPSPCDMTMRMAVEPEKRQSLTWAASHEPSGGGVSADGPERRREARGNHSGVPGCVG